MPPAGDGKSASLYSFLHMGHQLAVGFVLLKLLTQKSPSYQPLLSWEPWYRPCQGWGGYLCPVTPDRGALFEDGCVEAETMDYYLYMYTRWHVNGLGKKHLLSGCASRLFWSLLLCVSMSVSQQSLCVWREQEVECHCTHPWDPVITTRMRSRPIWTEPQCVDVTPGTGLVIRPLTPSLSPSLS